MIQTAKPSESPQSSQIFPMCFSIQSQTCTVDSGRQAAVTIGKMRTYLEYGQVPAEQIGALVRCLIGILHIRFSLLWAPCVEALAAALQHSSQQAWPLVLHQLTTAQATFLSGSHTAPTTGGSGGGHFSEPQDTAQVPQLYSELSKAMHGGDVDQNGGCTDAAVRLGNMLKAMAKAPANSMESKSRDWVPQFITFSTARGSNILADSATQPHASAASESESDPDSDSDLSDSDSDSETLPPSLAHDENRTHPDVPTVATAALGTRHDKAKQKSQQPRASHGVRVGAKAWRSQLREWLAFVGGIKGAKGVFRTADLKQCVVRHLLDTDSAVQQAALRSLQVHLAIPLLLSSCLCHTHHSFCRPRHCLGTHSALGQAVTSCS